MDGSDGLHRMRPSPWAALPRLFRTDAPAPRIVTAWGWTRAAVTWLLLAGAGRPQGALARPRGQHATPFDRFLGTGSTAFGLASGCLPELCDRVDHEALMLRLRITAQPNTCWLVAHGARVAGDTALDLFLAQAADGTAMAPQAPGVYTVGQEAGSQRAYGNYFHYAPHAAPGPRACLNLHRAHTVGGLVELTHVDPGRGVLGGHYDLALSASVRLQGSFRGTYCPAVGAAGDLPDAGNPTDLTVTFAGPCHNDTAPRGEPLRPSLWWRHPDGQGR